ncbi:MAG TPA: O-antigen ligase family protein [Saprospiraceae bacterium]|nr:O-antigen ligase family protein [Saprospiraceae bacterium]
MVLSPFLLSVSMWLLVFASWWHTAQHLNASLREANTWWLVLQVSFQRLYQQKVLLVFSLLLLAPALSAFWSEDTRYWLRLVQTRLPFLVLPWAFANHPPFTDRQLKLVLYLFVWFMTAVCIAVGIHFLLHYDAIVEGLGRGNPVPVPRSHVRFSLILATSILTGAWLWQQKFWLRKVWERHLLGATVIFLFLFIHVLSVRSGLFSLYAAMFFAAVWYIWKSRRWLTGLAALCVMVGGLWTAVATIPSLKMRVAYMKWDWGRFRYEDDGHLYSDAGRWISLRSGWELWRENPVLGVGAGDLLSETNRMTAQLYPSYAEDPKLPHNQFLFIMASTGMLGLVLSLAALFYPWYHERNNFLYLALQMMALASFLIECTLENAIGVAWFLFYSLWFMLCKQKNPTDNIS